jgi:hypothetical protein
MDGKFQTNLNANVTHLICGTCAASEKYFVNLRNYFHSLIDDLI